jgi:hypothetical protein
MSDNEQPWLLDLGTEQLESPAAANHYDEEQQLTLQEPDVRVIDVGGDAKTKKADREVGEDQKAHW